MTASSFAQAAPISGTKGAVTATLNGNRLLISVKNLAPFSATLSPPEPQCPTPTSVRFAGTGLNTEYPLVVVTVPSVGSGGCYSFTYFYAALLDQGSISYGRVLPDPYDYKPGFQFPIGRSANGVIYTYVFVKSVALTPVGNQYLLVAQPLCEGPPGAIPNLAASKHLMSISVVPASMYAVAAVGNVITLGWNEVVTPSGISDGAERIARSSTPEELRRAAQCAR